MRAALGRLGAAQDGVTLIELLVVLAILGVILAGLTQVFTSALAAQTDQTNRVDAQTKARLALDKLRREIRCASDVTPGSAYPASSITITLGSYCPTAGGAATVTWCTKNTSGAQPYTLWRYIGPNCSGTGTQWASDLVDKADAPSVTSGKIFDSTRVGAPTLTATSGGNLGASTYTYDVGAVLGSGIEIPGTLASVPATADSKVTVAWTAYTGAGTVVSYNVYGRDAGAGLRLLRNVSSGTTSYVDTGPTKITDNPLTLPLTPPNTPINVADTSNFPAGPNTITFGPSGPVTCTGTTATSFTNCTGGQAGTYPRGTVVNSASSGRPPKMALSVTLPVDKTPANASQRFVVADDIVLRNSQPF